MDKDSMDRAARRAVMVHVPRPTSKPPQDIQPWQEHALVQAIFETVQAFGTRGVRLPWVCVSEGDWKKLYNEALTGGMLKQGPVVSRGYPEFYVCGVKVMCVPDAELTIEGKSTPRMVPGY